MELVTWSPRVGATGDDRYNVPGAIPLAGGAADTSGPSRVDAGLSTFSSTPTIPEIDASSSVNQLFAEYNRRVAAVTADFSPAVQMSIDDATSGVTNVAFPSAVSYVSPDTRALGSSDDTVSAGATNLVKCEGLTYTFSAPFSAGTRMRGASLADFRKGLTPRTASTRLLSAQSVSTGAFVTGNALRTSWTGSTGSPSTIGYAAYLGGLRWRIICQRYIPRYLSDSSLYTGALAGLRTGGITILGFGGDGRGVPFTYGTVGVYIITGNTSRFSTAAQFAAIAESPATMVGTVSASSPYGVKSVTLSAAAYPIIAAAAGGFVKVMFAIVEEYNLGAGAPSGNVLGQAAGQIGDGVSSAWHRNLTINFT